MAYTLDELYNAIAATKRVVGDFTMSDEREFGSGSLYFTSDINIYIQVYASPMWNEEQGSDFVVESDIITHTYIDLQLVLPTNDIVPPALHIQLTGDLKEDVESYFGIMKGYLGLLNKHRS